MSRSRTGLTFSEPNLAFETAPSRDELLKMFFKLPLEFQPGATWAYDNTGYYLLGIIIEKASGKSYWQFLDERIFKPLGMNATIPKAEELMKAAHKNYEPVIYKGAGHGFMRSGEPINPNMREGDKKTRDEAWARWKTLLKQL